MSERMNTDTTGSGGAEAISDEAVEAFYAGRQAYGCDNGPLADDCCDRAGLAAALPHLLAAVDPYSAAAIQPFHDGYERGIAEGRRQAVGALVVQPGDTLIVAMSGEPAAATAHAVHDGLKERLPGLAEVIVLTGTQAIAAYRPDATRVAEGEGGGHGA